MGVDEVGIMEIKYKDWHYNCITALYAVEYYYNTKEAVEEYYDKYGVTISQAIEVCRKYPRKEGYVYDYEAVEELREFFLSNQRLREKQKVYEGESKAKEFAKFIDTAVANLAPETISTLMRIMSGKI